MFKFYIYKFGQFCVTRLPLAWSYGIAIFMSDLHYLLSFRDRRAVRNNLQAIFPDKKDVTPMMREVFRNFGRYLVEFFRMRYFVDENYVNNKVRIHNLEAIDEVLSKGKGAVFVSGHLGNWEMGGVVLSLKGHKSVAIALPHKERPVNELFNDQREFWGLTVVPMQQAVRKCLSVLHDNGIVAVVADRDFTQNGRVMDFLNRKALIPKGAALFASKTGAGIVPVFFMREENNEFSLHISDPIYPSSIVSNGQVDDEILLEMMEKYKSVIEQKVKEYPTQWLMFRQFWVDES